MKKYFEFEPSSNSNMNTQPTVPIQGKTIDETLKMLMTQLSPFISMSVLSYLNITNTMMAMQITTIISLLLGYMLSIDIMAIAEKLKIRSFIERFIKSNRYEYCKNVYYVTRYRIPNGDLVTNQYKYLVNKFFPPDSKDRGIVTSTVPLIILKNHVFFDTFNGVKVEIAYRYGDDKGVTQDNFLNTASYFKIKFHCENVVDIDGYIKSLKPAMAETKYSFYYISRENTPNHKPSVQENHKYCKTSKTRRTLSLSHSVEHKIFSRIESFLKSRDVYLRRGIAYSYGMILYGPPGTGKTSIIKAISTEFDLKLLTLNLNDVENEHELRMLVNAVSDSLKQTSLIQQHLLIFEDFDRSKFFKNKEMMDVFYNFLDGVDEADGRIAIITCNNESDILNDKALYRPGRFDDAIHISYADRYQVERMMRVYYDSNDIVFSEDEFSKIKYPITPAQIQNIFFWNTEVDGARRDLYNWNGVTEKTTKEERLC